MQTQYNQRIDYKVRSAARMQKTQSEAPTREMVVYWGDRQNAVCTTPEQAIGFIRVNRDSDIN